MTVWEATSDEKERKHDSIVERRRAEGEDEGGNDSRSMAFLGKLQVSRGGSRCDAVFDDDRVDGETAGRDFNECALAGCPPEPVCQGTGCRL